MKYYPLTLLERFEVVMAMFPDKLNDEDHDLGDEEDIIEEEFGMDPADFDKLVGRLVTLAPIQQSPMSGELHHVLGSVKLVGESQRITAAVKREVQDV